jgi:tartrate dehydratase beta subunit/fumarate hydratase class I family protein
MQSAPMPISAHLALLTIGVAQLAVEVRHLIREAISMHLALTIGVAQLAVEVRQLRDLGEELGLSRKCLVQDLALLT